MIGIELQTSGVKSNLLLKWATAQKQFLTLPTQLKAVELLIGSCHYHNW